MKKQILYTSFMARLFSTSIDLLVLFFVLSGLFNIISRYVFMYIFNDFFADNPIEESGELLVFYAVRNPNFVEHATLKNCIIYCISMFCINITFIGSYFVTCWYKTGSTIGKMFMRMRIVDNKTHTKLSLYQCIKRFIASIVGFLALWLIAFNDKGRGLHDMIAHTVVIKK